MAKRKVVNAPTVIEEGEDKITMFGWCLTGHHDGCIVKFPRHRCACKCHERGSDDE